LLILRLEQVPAYQPETAWKIFQRALFNYDIATGNISTIENPNYTSEGPKDVYDIRNEPVVDPGSQCYVLDQGQCTADQWETVMNGTALIKNWIVVDANTSYLFPDLVGSIPGSGNGTKPSGTPTVSGSPQYTGAASSIMTTRQVMGHSLGVDGVAMVAVVVGGLLML
jgi:hypothetical protein